VHDQYYYLLLKGKAILMQSRQALWVPRGRGS